MTKQSAPGKDCIELEKSFATPEKDSSSIDEHADHSVTEENKFTGDFDELLELAGGFGRFQCKLYIYLQMPFIFLGFIYLSQIWLVLEPDHWCNVPQLAALNLSNEAARRISSPVESLDKGGGHSKCFMYDIDYSQDNITSWIPQDATPVVRCKHGWRYNFSSIYPTIVSDLDWVCDDAWKATLTSGVFFIGAFFGTAIFSHLSDRYGRLPTLILTNMVACVAGVLSAFSKSLFFFAFTRFIYGMAYNTQFSLAMVLMSEFVGPRYRSMVVNVPLATTLCLTTVAIPWLARFLGHWHWMALCTSLPMAFILLYLVVDVPESCRWLQQTGQLQKALTKMEHIATTNGRTISRQQWLAFREAAEKQKDHAQTSSEQSLLELLRYPTLLRRTVLLVFAMMMVMLSFDLIVRFIKLDADVYTVQSVLGLSEAPADFLTWLLLESVGRRWTACGAMISTSVFALIEFFLIRGSASDGQVVTIVAVFVCRCCCTIGVNTILQQSIELFPTGIRARGFGLTQMASMLSVALSPFLLHLNSWLHGLPLLFLSITALVSAATLFFLPETKNYPLPETLDEGDKFGRDQKYFQCYWTSNDGKSDDKSEAAVAGYDNTVVQAE